MTYKVIDRLSGQRLSALPADALLGRYVVEPLHGSSVFLNSFSLTQPAFCVPDLRGRWSLVEPGSDRCEGAMSRSQLLTRLELSSISNVGTSVRDILSSGGSWSDAVDLSPLVPGMSERAELQPFEKLLQDRLQHLVAVCQRPRTHLRVEVERTAVHRARRLPTQAPAYLSAHTEDWDRPTLRSVIPKRILALVREEQFDIYENRVAVCLVDRLSGYLSDRVREVSMLLGVFNDAEKVGAGAGQGSHWRQRRLYQLWGDSLSAGESRHKAEVTLRELKRLQYKVLGLMDSILYREVPRHASVSTRLTMTNILANDENYRAVAEIWLAYARVGVAETPRPEKHFAEMQQLCQCFGAFAVLLSIRAGDQLGMGPLDVEGSMAGSAVSLEGAGGRGQLSWSFTEGTLRFAPDGSEALRVVAIPVSLPLLPEEQLSEFIRDADAAATEADETLLILYPSSGASDALLKKSPALSARLNALSHETAGSGRGRAGFMPVSPWELSSVERIARELRWVTTAPKLLAYPPVIELPLPKGVRADAHWLEARADCVAVTRLPEAHEELNLDSRLRSEGARLEQLELEHEQVSSSLRRAAKGGAASGPLSARKRDLHAAIAALRAEIDALSRFSTALTASVAYLKTLLRCPTCGVAADSRADFNAGDGRRFSCVCPDCTTSWGTEACPECRGWIPTLMPALKSWADDETAHGWLDRFLGADVLAQPVRLEDGSITFVCPHCGHHP